MPCQVQNSGHRTILTVKRRPLKYHAQGGFGILCGAQEWRHHTLLAGLGRLDRDVPHAVSGAEETVAIPTTAEEESKVQTDDTEPIAEETDREQVGDLEVDASGNSIDDEESSDDTATPFPETDDATEDVATSESSEEPDTRADR